LNKAKFQEPIATSKRGKKICSPKPIVATDQVEVIELDDEDDPLSISMDDMNNNPSESAVNIDLENIEAIPATNSYRDFIEAADKIIKEAKRKPGPACSKRTSPPSRKSGSTSKKGRLLKASPLANSSLKDDDDQSINVLSKECSSTPDDFSIDIDIDDFSYSNEESNNYTSRQKPGPARFKKNGKNRNLANKNEDISSSINDRNISNANSEDDCIDDEVNEFSQYCLETEKTPEKPIKSGDIPEQHIDEFAEFSSLPMD